MSDKLTVKEKAFIDEYLYGINKSNITASFRAVYKKDDSSNAYKVFKRERVQKAIKEEQDKQYRDKTASAHEITAFLSAVVRGEVLDTFGLEASVADRLQASKQLSDILIKPYLKQVSENDINVSITYNKSEDTLKASDIASEIIKELENESLEDE